MFKICIPCLKSEGGRPSPFAKNKRALLCALASAVYAGAGLLLCKNLLKGIIYAVVYSLILLLTALWIVPSIRGLITLGDTSMVDHSLILMIYGLLALIILTFCILFYVGNIRETYRYAVAYEAGTIEKKPIKQRISEWLHEKSAILFLLPGLIAILAGVALPLMFSICIGFTDYDATHAPPRYLLNWVGLANFQKLLRLGQYAKTFGGVLLWTVEWTVFSSTLPYILGILLAVVLSNPRIRCKKLFKIIYILPWAIPAYISLLVLQSMFDTNYGLINQLLGLVGIDKIPWLTQKTPARIALILVSIWTGFSFPMMLTESIIGSIDKSVYEAAKLDGASSARILFSITLPLLMFSISPMFIMNLAGAFNNFNTIYLVTGGWPLNLEYQGAGDTDILISWLFKLTINNNLYNLGSAISMILFIFIALFSIFNLRRTKSFKEEDILQ